MSAGIRARLEVRVGGFCLRARFDAPGRGITALFGPSGCGKSTLLRAIAGLGAGARGLLQVDGETWLDSRSGVCRAAHQRAVGYVFQEPSLFAHLSVVGNLDFAWRRNRNRDRIDRDSVIALLGLGHLLARRPGGLSGGERQRVAIARALLSGPDLLLLDEPMSALDDDSKREIMPYLEQLHSELEIPALLVSHDRSEVTRLADHMVLMEPGRVSAQGPLSTLLARADLPLARDIDAVTVLEGRVAGHDNDDAVTLVECGGRRYLLPLVDLPIGSRHRLQVPARDVSIGLDDGGASSILNRVPARVLDLQDRGDGRCLARLVAGESILLAQISRRSVRQLALRPGQEVVAQVKALSILGPVRGAADAAHRATPSSSAGLVAEQSGRSVMPGCAAVCEPGGLAP